MENVNLTFIPSYYGEWITFNTQTPAVRQRQGPPGAELRGRQGRAPRALLARHACHEGDARLPAALDVRAGRSGRRPGTSCPPTTRTSRRPVSSSTSPASPTSSTARPSPTTSRRRRSRASASTSSTSMSQLGHHDRGREGHVSGGGRAPVRGARRLRHHRRHLGLRLPRPLGQPAPELRVREHRGRRRERVRRTRTRRSTSCCQQQNQLTDKAERARLLIEAQALIAEDSPIIPVSNPGWPLATNKRVQGAEVGSLWYWGSLFKDIWVTE